MLEALLYVLSSPFVVFIIALLIVAIAVTAWTDSNTPDPPPNDAQDPPTVPRSPS